MPPVLVEHQRVECEAIPTRDEAAEVRSSLTEDNRVLVCGNDADLAGLLTRFLRAEALDIEIAYVSDGETPATRAWGLPTGAQAAKLAIEGTAREVPLIRDDTGTVLVGEATVTGAEGTALVGEAYADDTRLFSGTIEALTVRPMSRTPGVRAGTGRRRGLLRRRHWTEARAVQLGTEGGIVTRDGVTGRRPVKRTTFYRNVEPWNLVLP